MELKDIKNLYNTTYDSYKNNVEGKFCGDYSASKYCSVDKVFLSKCDELINEIRAFESALSKIQCPSNYTNTLSDIAAIKGSISGGLSNINTINSSVVEASKAAFTDLVNLYNSYHDSAESVQGRFNGSYSSANGFLSLYNATKDKAKYSSYLSYKSNAYNAALEFSKIALRMERLIQKGLTR